MMKKEDIQTLADLARLSITDQECEAYQKDFESILGYIDTIKGAELHDGGADDQVVANVVREDIETYEPGSSTEDLLNEAPHREGNFVKVDKIL